jgi:catalase
MMSANTPRLNYLILLVKKHQFLLGFRLLPENGDHKTLKETQEVYFYLMLGFAVKFYTEEGNWDMTGNNTPIFFIRDPIKFPDFIHSQKKDPRTNLKSPTAAWDFWSLSPESTHQVTYLMGERGIPDGYRHMNGYSSHTFRWVNKQGEAHWVKLHFKVKGGCKNLTAKQGNDLLTDPEYATRDLVNHLDAGKTVEWDLSVQVIPEKDGFSYKWNIFDVTKIVPHSDYPLIPVGKLVLNRTVDNFFA